MSRKKFKNYDVIIQEINDMEEKIKEKKEEAIEALDRDYQDKLAKLRGVTNV